MTEPKNNKRLTKKISFPWAFSIYCVFFTLFVRDKIVELAKSRRDGAIAFAIATGALLFLLWYAYINTVSHAITDPPREGRAVRMLLRLFIASVLGSVMLILAIVGIMEPEIFKTTFHALENYINGFFLVLAIVMCPMIALFLLCRCPGCGNFVDTTGPAWDFRWARECPRCHVIFN